MYFYGTYIKNDSVDNLMDLARLVVEPDYARKSHVTLRGPYKSRPRKTSKWLARAIGPATLTKTDVFFSDQQNTVYLRLEIDGISEIWSKPDYPNGVPHISVYDGGDRKFAWEVFRTLRKFPWQIRLQLTDISILEKKKDLVTGFIFESEKLQSALNLVGARQYRAEEIKNMHTGQRLYLLNSICEKIHAVTGTSIVGKPTQAKFDI